MPAAAAAASSCRSSSSRAASCAITAKASSRSPTNVARLPASRAGCFQPVSVEIHEAFGSCRPGADTHASVAQRGGQRVFHARRSAAVDNVGQQPRQRGLSELRTGDRDQEHQRDQSVTVRSRPMTRKTSNAPRPGTARLPAGGQVRPEAPGGIHRAEMTMCRLAKAWSTRGSGRTAFRRRRRRDAVRPRSGAVGDVGSVRRRSARDRRRHREHTCRAVGSGARGGRRRGRRGVLRDMRDTR